MNNSKNTFTTNRLNLHTVSPRVFVRLDGIERGLITDELSILVKPPNNFYWDRFIDIHHITPEITRNAPNFNQIWNMVEPFIKN